MQPRPFPEPRSRGKFQPFVPSELRRLYDTVTSRANISAAPGQGAGFHVDGTGPHFYTNASQDGGFWATVLADVSANPSDPATQRVYTWTSAIDDQDGDFTTGGLEAPDGQQLSSANLPYLPAYEVNNQTVAPGTVVRLFWGWGPWLYFAVPASTGGGGIPGADLTVKNVDGTQSTNPCSVIQANNDQGTKAFARVHVTNEGGGAAQLDWQGFTLTSQGSTYGPEPDLALEPGTNITITASDDSGSQRTKAIIGTTGTAAGLDVKNQDNTQDTPNCTLIKANNDLGTYSGGRIHWLQTTTGQGRLDWQGFRGYLAGTGTKGPAVDLELVRAGNITLTLDVDPAGSSPITGSTDCLIITIGTTGTAAGLDVVDADGAAQDVPQTIQMVVNDVDPVGGLVFTNQNGRLYWKKTAAGKGQIDWSGLCVYQSGTGLIGPAPNLQFLAGTNITSITSVYDGTHNSVDVTINAAGAGTVSIPHSHISLTADYLVTTTYANSGLSVTLPTGGHTYLLMAKVLGFVSSDEVINWANLKAKLRDTTGGHDLPGSETRWDSAPATGQAMLDATPIFSIYQAPVNNTVVQLWGQTENDDGSSTFKFLGDASGLQASTLTYIDLGV